MSLEQKKSAVDLYPIMKLRDQSAQNQDGLKIEEMWNISKRITSAWGISGYKAPRIYTDPIQQIKDRDYLKQKKGQKDKRHVTQKGSYLDFNIKLGKQLPGPEKYDTVKPWPEAKNKDAKAPKDVPKNKNTFLDKIIFEASKKRGIPGPGTYDLRQTDKQVEEERKKLANHKILVSTKTNFLQEFEYLSNTIPGPGNHNPHEIRTQSRQSRKEDNPKDWQKKHKELDLQFKKKTKTTNGPGTYNPESCMYKTFTKMKTTFSKMKEDKKPEKLFGTSERFINPLKTKSKQFVNVPGPGQYQMIAKWPGKWSLKNKDEVKKMKNWMNVITKGSDNENVYYNKND